MNVSELAEARGEEVAELASALRRFERQFWYPLGETRRFRICHGENYGQFFEAIGDAACFVARRDGEVMGVLGGALRPLIYPDGLRRKVCYFGDLKLAPDARNGFLLMQLMRRAMQWAMGRCDAAFGVMMEGTGRSPTVYTGRAGIPGFETVGELMVLHIATEPGRQSVDWRRLRVKADSIDRTMRHLVLGRFATPCADSTLRSRMAAVPLRLPDQSACGLVEDTQQVKRLFDDHGEPIVSTHLSGFAWRDAASAAALIRAALRCTAWQGIPAMFVSVPRGEAEGIVEQLRGAGVEPVEAPARVFGCGLRDDLPWHVNTSEI